MLPVSPLPLPESLRVARRYKAKLSDQFKSDGRIDAFIGEDRTTIILYVDHISDGSFDKKLEGVHAYLANGEEAHKKVSAGRVLALGVLALAAKKQVQGSQFVVIEGPDFVWTVEAGEGLISAAAKFAGKVNNAVRQYETAHQISATLAPPNPATSNLGKQLEQLSELHFSGALSNAEFSAAKSRLLGI
ncbi:hypothetical protein CRD59_00775 [Bifidobacterium xylocopae]|uniref:SHOCT domain-containing protein n=2 Tax=Bifidobacterium xylocopae TaxID=2493119 RepID=A0A366KFR0_9BIFI|nr:hypothetical protein CRD59_00775 [Bifidobacterium xylocopae]